MDHASVAESVGLSLDQFGGLHFLFFALFVCLVLFWHFYCPLLTVLVELL